MRKFSLLFPLSGKKFQGFERVAVSGSAPIFRCRPDRTTPPRQDMSQASLDVIGIGNAIVDVIAHADDAFVEREGLVKGTMTLVDAPRAEALYRLMGPAVEISGG